MRRRRRIAEGKEDVKMTQVEGFNEEAKKKRSGGARRGGGARRSTSLSPRFLLFLLCVCLLLLRLLVNLFLTLSFSFSSDFFSLSLLVSACFLQVAAST